MGNLNSRYLYSKKGYVIKLFRIMQNINVFMRELNSQKVSTLFFFFFWIVESFQKLISMAAIKWMK